MVKEGRRREWKREKIRESNLIYCNPMCAWLEPSPPPPSARYNWTFVNSLPIQIVGWYFLILSSVLVVTFFFLVRQTLPLTWQILYPTYNKSHRARLESFFFFTSGGWGIDCTPWHHSGDFNPADAHIYSASTLSSPWIDRFEIAFYYFPFIPLLIDFSPKTLNGFILFIFFFFPFLAGEFAVLLPRRRQQDHD